MMADKTLPTAPATDPKPSEVDRVARLMHSAFVRFDTLTSATAEVTAFDDLTERSRAAYRSVAAAVLRDQAARKGTA